VSNGIIVHTDLIKDDPEIIRSFFAASGPLAMSLFASMFFMVVALLAAGFGR